jgi:hypothetical protein
MALADYQSNALTGPAGGGDFDIFRMDATQAYAIGTRITRTDGNEFVYSHFLTDSAAGTVVGPDVSEGGEVAAVDGAVIAPASAAAVPGTNVTAGSAGSKYVQFTNAGILKDEHAGGYFITVNDAGEGYTYRIKGNSATGGPATGDVLIELYDPIQVALTTASDVMILGSKYSQLIKATGAGGEDNLAVGVTCANMDVSVASYGWVCTKGIIGALVDGTIAAGEAVTLSDGVAGSLQVMAGGTTAVADAVDERVIGQCVIPDASAGQACFQVNFN